jgi:hypothetical protein
VAVVAGREKPRWAEATRSAIPQQYLDSQLVGHFSPTDASDYLQKADIKDAALQHVDQEIEVAVHALSACRAFDFELYLKLGQTLHFHATRAAFFDILTRFSFVWQVQRRGENWYRIHDLLRRLGDESGNETTHRAHQVLEQHYRERGEVAEAILSCQPLGLGAGCGGMAGGV